MLSRWIVICDGPPYRLATSSKSARETVTEPPARPIRTGSAKAEFLEPGVWAISQRLYGWTLFDAEQRGISDIDAALDQLALDAHFSSTSLPGGGRRPFDRRDRFGDPRRTDQVVVRAKSGRAWLRTVSALAYDIQAARTTDRLALPISGDQPEYDLALAAWRRAAGAVDRRTAAVALWEAIEFYAAGAQLDQAFADDQVATIVSAASIEGLSSEQQHRVDEVLRQFLNQPPATTRLRACLDRDAIPYTEIEFGALKRLRGPRSHAQHGKRSPEPAEADVELCVGVVNRILAYWGAAIASG